MATMIISSLGGRELTAAPCVSSSVDQRRSTTTKSSGSSAAMTGAFPFFFVHHQPFAILSMKQS